MSGDRTGSPAELARRFRDAAAAWRGEGLPLHALALALLVLVLVVRWWSIVTFPVPLNDEMPYFGAFQRVAAGRSPYLGRGYIYPPIPAVVGGWSLNLFGLGATLALVRLTNLLGLAASVWCALAWVPWRWRSRLAAAAIFLCVAPAVRYSVLLGNLSLLVGGMLLAALMLWRRRPWTAAALLGVGLVIKPLAPVALVMLLCHRPAGGGRGHWRAALASGAVALVLLLAFPYFGEMLALDIGGRLGRTVSLHRFAALAGLPDSTLWLTAALTVVAVLLVRLRPLGEGQVLLASTAAALAVSPLVWSHTLIVALPLQVIALTVAWQRFEAERLSGAPPPGLSRRYELILVVLAVAAIQWAEGATGIDDQGLLLQALGAVPPSCAPPALTAYVVATTDSF